MKKLLILSTIYLLFSCEQHYKVEVTYYTGEKEIVDIISHNGLHFDDGCVGGNNIETRKCYVRSFKIIK